jgi:ssDNA-specific exonuclease RecJ
MPVGLSPTEKPSYQRETRAIEEAFKGVGESQRTAESALRTVQSKTKLLEDLENNNMDAYTGALADFKLSVAKIREQFMGDTPEAIALREKITSTEFLSSRMGADVFAMLKPLGIGARGLDTPAERKFLQEVLTGKIGLQRDTLIKMTRLSRDSNKKIVDNFYNRIGKSPALKTYLKERGIEKDRYKLGGQAKRVKINNQGEVIEQ